MPAWIWALAGAAGMALIFAAIRLLRRREDTLETALPVPAPEPEPAAAPAPPRVPAAPARPSPPPGLTPPAPASSEPFELALQPRSIEIGASEVLLEFELLIGNRQPGAAENIRPTFALISASPEQDRHIAGFHGNPMVDPGSQAFDLAAGAGGRMPVRLALPRAQIHAVDIGGRAIFVPIVMIDLRWRAGISIRRFGADFMVGTPGQGGKLGPFRLDGPQAIPQLAATRYIARAAAAA
ncbi:hypothetical protein AB2M62_02790 [Sphingomonas sp. MMS12-HWE2-04]|uniref:hypothetical protein n=1 Tax=Sphingomonas sp. MMS12-HWE2-04 TaxID=3234199 RepID=UPI00384A93D3